MFYKIIVSIVKIAFAIWYNIKFEGKENIPKDKGCIYASNHRTYADPPLVVIGVKRRFSFVAKEELFRNKFFGWLISKLGAFPVSRGSGDTAVIDKAVSRLQSGDNLVIFPEGTRSKDGKIGKGKSGAAVIAVKAGVPIVPVGIVWSGEKLKFRTKIRVIFGKPIDTSEFAPEDGEDINPRSLIKLKNRYMADIKELAGQADMANNETPKN